MAMVDIINSIQECRSQFVALLPKHIHSCCQFKLLLVIISGIYQDHCLKCDVEFLAIKSCFISQHLPNSSTILPKNISFKFGRMNCDPFDVSLVCRPQGYYLGVEPYLLHHYRITLLSFCWKFPKFGNGGIHSYLRMSWGPPPLVALFLTKIELTNPTYRNIINSRCCLRCHNTQYTKKKWQEKEIWHTCKKGVSHLHGWGQVSLL